MRPKLSLMVGSLAFMVGMAGRASADVPCADLAERLIAINDELVADLEPVYVEDHVDWFGPCDPEVEEHDVLMEQYDMGWTLPFGEHLTRYTDHNSGNVAWHAGLTHEGITLCENGSARVTEWSWDYNGNKSICNTLPPQD